MVDIIVVGKGLYIGTGITIIMVAVVGSLITPVVVNVLVVSVSELSFSREMVIQDPVPVGELNALLYCVIKEAQTL